MKLSKALLCIALIFSNAVPASNFSFAQEVGRDFNKQVMCMAKNLYYEAATESYEGKLAVAQVTINRTNSRNYPSDVCGVVYQKTNNTCQFSWTCMKVPEIKNEYAWEEAMYIARRALTNAILHKELAKANALYYHATYVSPGWNRKIIKRIGNHIFYA